MAGRGNDPGNESNESRAEAVASRILDFREMRRAREASGVGIRAAFALVLVAGLLALPRSMAAAASAGCCGPDCSPCPVSLCKTTTADRAVVPEVAAPAPAAPQAAVLVFVDGYSPAPAAPADAIHAPRAFHPLRN